jgi:hypothetical protein
MNHSMLDLQESADLASIWIAVFMVAALAMIVAGMML